jgi:hypothetical protein
MKKTVLIAAAASALLLSACAQQPTTRAAVPLPFDNKNPKVYIVGGEYIVVDQEPIVFLRGERGRIKWRLQDSDYRFDPGSGISGIKVLSGQHNDIKDCRVDNKEGSEFSCQNDNNGYGTYKYTIVITRKKDNKQLLLDPTIGND